MGDADPTVPQLLSSQDPSVRYLTLTEVLGRSPRSAEVRRVRAAIPAGPRVRALLRGQRNDGGFGVHPYAKWTGAFWRLVSLVELAVPPRHRRVLAALGNVLDWLHSPRHRASITTIGGLVRIHATQEGYALAVACRLGVAEEARVRALAGSLLQAQWPDGGWNCDPRPEATHSSFHETVGPLWGLAEFAAVTGDPSSQVAADRAAEFFLRHGMYRSHRSGAVAHEELVRLHYPPYWHYDLLWGLLTLARAGGIADPRAGDALDRLQAKRGADGWWRADGRRYWRAPGSTGSGVEVVDWRGGGAREMLTLNALRVLRAAGRLHPHRRGALSRR